MFDIDKFDVFEQPWRLRKKRADVKEQYELHSRYNGSCREWNPRTSTHHRQRGRIKRKHELRELFDEKYFQQTHAFEIAKEIRAADAGCFCFFCSFHYWKDFSTKPRLNEPTRRFGHFAFAAAKGKRSALVASTAQESENDKLSRRKQNSLADMIVLGGMSTWCFFETNCYHYRRFGHCSRRNAGGLWDRMDTMLQDAETILREGAPNKSATPNIDDTSYCCYDAEDHQAYAASEDFQWHQASLFCLDVAKGVWSKVLHSEMARDYSVPGGRCAVVRFTPKQQERQEQQPATSKKGLFFVYPDTATGLLRVAMYDLDNHRGFLEVDQTDAPFVPTSRQYFSLVVRGDKLIVFGGFFSDENQWNIQESTNELLQFDVTTGEWTQIPVRSPLPTKRGYHAATMLDDRRMAISGGVFLTKRKEQVTLQTGLGQGQVITVFDDGQPGAVRTPNVDFRGPKLFDKILDDILIFDFAKLRWSQIGRMDGAQYLHSLVSLPLAIDECNNRFELITYGGRNQSHMARRTKIINVDEPDQYVSERVEVLSVRFPVPAITNAWRSTIGEFAASNVMCDTEIHISET